MNGLRAVGAGVPGPAVERYERAEGLLIAVQQVVKVVVAVVDICSDVELLSFKQKSDAFIFEKIDPSSFQSEYLSEYQFSV
ncbi:MAG: hypothetical protein WCA48_17500 [Pseudomonas gingeri]